MSNFLEKLDIISSDPSVISAMLFIWSIILGVIIALFVSFYHRKVTGSFFRAFVKAGAIDEENAKTLAEVSQTENDAVIAKLERPGVYRSIVTVINPDGTEADPHSTITITEETKFYIPEEKLTQVRDQWGENNENLLVLIGGVLGMVILGVLLTIIVISGI
ncbi:MAG: hypothetical protein IJX55_03330 [Clostridia bacterium]|nr:hypothetical protein [Clostridia bacterium]